ncbi:MAG: TPM domain-containing protein [Salinivirgaceae bacterium]|nr:TPM domain-containing protein [Salinivirgaceae bacterium]
MRRILFIITFLAVVTNAFADIFERPAEMNLVIDSANAFTLEQNEALTTKLDSFERATTVQIQIFTTTDLQGYNIADFAQRLGEGWGVGQAETDNGIVIVYKPKTDSTSGEVTIQTGYGIEALIPDAICKRIIDCEMIPRFRNDSVYDGISKAVDVCISLVKGEFTAEDYQKQTDEDDGFAFRLTLYIIGGMVGFWVLIFIIIGLYLLIFDNSRSYGSSSGSSSSSSGHHSSYHGSSHRSYGGGHFGGGGASGRW